MMIQTINRWRNALIILTGLLLLTAAIEYLMGRMTLGPDGRFGLWEGDIWSSENSQRFADPYSFSHIAHGILLFGVLTVFARKLPTRYRFLLALGIEVSWELLENSPLIINRYRNATIALGYAGDSIMNSISDVIMMCVGFAFAANVRLWVSILAILVMEIGCAIWVRDNLTLNIIMLIHPVEAITHWQMAGHPLP